MGRGLGVPSVEEAGVEGGVSEGAGLRIQVFHSDSQGCKEEMKVGIEFKLGVSDT